MESCEFMNEFTPQNLILAAISPPLSRLLVRCFRCLCFWTLTFHNYNSLTSSAFLSYASGGLLHSEYLTINQRNAAQAARQFVWERERERERESQLYRSVFSVITHNWEIRRASNPERRLIDRVCLASEKHLRVNIYVLSGKYLHPITDLS